MPVGYFSQLFLDDHLTGAFGLLYYSMGLLNQSSCSVFKRGANQLKLGFSVHNCGDLTGIQCTARKDVSTDERQIVFKIPLFSS